MLVVSVLTLILAGLLISHIVHRTTLSNRLYLEAKKFQVSALAYFTFLLMATTGFLPVILLTIFKPSISVELICSYAVILYPSLIAITIYMSRRLGMTEYYRYWSLGRSLVTLVTTTTVVLTLSTLLVSYSANKLVSQSGVVSIPPLQATLTPTVPGSGIPTPSARSTNVFNWIEAHPETTSLIGVMCSAIIVAVLSVAVAIIGKSSKK